MVFWSFVPLVQAAVFAAALSLAALRSQRPKIAPALALYFTGHGPWMVLFWILAGVCLLAPHVYETMMWLDPERRPARHARSAPLPGRA